MKKLLLVLLLLIVAVPAMAKDVTLSWDASPTPEVTGYNVYFSTDPDMSTIVDGYPLDVGNVLTTKVSDLPDATGYYISVKAYNQVGQEAVYCNIVYSPGFVPPDPAENLGGTTTVNNFDVPIE